MFQLFAQNMQIKYLTESSWDAKVFGKVIVEKEEYIAPGFLKMNSKMYPKSWVLRKMFSENDGEILIKGEKSILRYSEKDEEYWLINVNEYFNTGEIDTASQRPLSRSLFFSLIFESLIDTSTGKVRIQREKVKVLCFVC